MRSLNVPAQFNLHEHPNPTLQIKTDYFIGRFEAMASPCEILIAGLSEDDAKTLTITAAQEAWRIEHKFSRYVSDNIIAKINNSRDEPIDVDEETARLLDYAKQCYELSDGYFDITSGVLRKVWRFDGSDKLPNKSDVSDMLEHVGWYRINWNNPLITLPEGMEIDFGGIGKEYAVDQTLQKLQVLLQQRPQEPLDPSGYSLLVNFGGDLACSGPRPDGQPWQVGVESNQALNQAVESISIYQGALATSGDSRRYLQHNGVRYGHVLDPKTGWPVLKSPHSVTVAAPSCTLAGMLATFALLNGEQAEDFLTEQKAKYWVQWS